MSLTILGRLDRLKNNVLDSSKLRITGFQSPAEDEADDRLSFDLRCRLNAPQNVVVRVDDETLVHFGFFPGDRLVIDRSAACAPDCLVMVDTQCDGQYRLLLMTHDQDGRLVLKARQEDPRPISLETEDSIEVFGRMLWSLSYWGGP